MPAPLHVAVPLFWSLRPLPTYALMDLAVALEIVSVPPEGMIVFVPRASEFKPPPSQLKFVMVQVAPRSSPFVKL